LTKKPEKSISSGVDICYDFLRDFSGPGRFFPDFGKLLQREEWTIPSTVAPGSSTQEADAADLALLIAALGAVGTIRLYQNTFAPNYSSTVTDFGANEATFLGYAPFVVTTWSAVGIDQNNQPTAFSADASFLCTAATTPNSIGGAFLVTEPTLSSHTVRYFPFPNPIPIANIGNFINVTVALQSSNQGYAEVAS
jgi:hypothetical protein